MLKRKNLKITKDFIAKQKANLMFQKNALEANDLNELFLLDEEFHKRFFDSSGLLYTWKIIENNTCSSYQRVRVLSMRVSGAAINILQQHEDLLEAAEAGDYEKMYKIDNNHLSKIDEEMPFLKEKFPTYFD
jgi:DNA-binding GntR family transcriptional regulator